MNNVLRKHVKETHAYPKRGKGHKNVPEEILLGVLATIMTVIMTVIFSRRSGLVTVSLMIMCHSWGTMGYTISDSGASLRDERLERAVATTPGHGPSRARVIIDKSTTGAAEVMGVGSREETRDRQRLIIRSY